jgi:hypothetical protein
LGCLQTDKHTVSKPPAPAPDASKNGNEHKRGHAENLDNGVVRDAPAFGGYCSFARESERARERVYERTAKKKKSKLCKT